MYGVRHTMAQQKSILFYFACFTFLHILSVEALECYTCDRQDTNKDKCIKTTKQCEEHQDICITSMKWGLPPYWIPYGDRMHYIWKDCDTSESCNTKKEIETPNCKRDWYDDWSCVECCSGDLCNHYVTLGVDGMQLHVVIKLVAVISTALIWTASL